MLRLLTVGEALVDWISTERGADLAGAGSFAKAAGGAPFNVAVGYARLGGPSAFAGRIGDDPFGAWLLSILRAEGVDTALATVAPGRPTRMAYVTTKADGDRELAHFSADAADAALTGADLPAHALAGFDALVFGSLPLAVPAARDAILAAARAMRDRGALVLFDPNPRPVLWPSDAALREAVEAGLAACTIAKLGDDEVNWLTGEQDHGDAVDAVRARFGLHAVVVTCGEVGSIVSREAPGATAGAFQVTPVDATGAGDAFVAGLLASLPADGWRDLDGYGWEAALNRANAVGALACTRAGAIAGLPDAAALAAFMASQGR